jgi:hypothetical protein
MKNIFLFILIIALFSLSFCKNNTDASSNQNHEKQEIDTNKSENQDIEKQIIKTKDISKNTNFTFDNFITECFEIPYQYFDNELDINEEYPEVANFEPDDKKTEAVINYLYEHYKTEFSNYPASVSIPLYIKTANYYALFVEYQNDAMNICNDLFVVDKKGNLIDKVIELTYSNTGADIITSEYMKIRKYPDNKIKINTVQKYEARNENSVLPDEPDYHYYEIGENGIIKELNESQDINMTKDEG